MRQCSSVRDRQASAGQIGCQHPTTSPAEGELTVVAPPTSRCPRRTVVIPATLRSRQRDMHLDQVSMVTLQLVQAAQHTPAALGPALA